MAKATRLCDMDGCERKHRARGLCTTHYNKQYDGPRPTVEVECPTCGETTTKQANGKSTRKFCSLACRPTPPKRSRELVHVGSPDPVTWLPKQHPVMRGAKPRRPHLWYAGNCAWCGDSFTDWQPASRYCSPRCGKQAGKYRRGRFAVPDSVRLGIYERDGWVCQLCLEPVDPDLVGTSGWSAWAPSLDHVQCQAWTEQPDHSPSNLRLAHMWCNAVRGDERSYTASDLRISHAA